MSVWVEGGKEEWMHPWKEGGGGCMAGWLAGWLEKGSER